MASTVPLSFRWEPEFVARVDAARGSVPRSRFVRGAVEAMLLDDTQASSPAGRKARSDADNGPARPASASPRGASRPAVSPRESKRCGAGCMVPVGSKLKRCVRHGLELRA